MNLTLPLKEPNRGLDNRFCFLPYGDFTKDRDLKGKGESGMDIGSQRIGDVITVKPGLLRSDATRQDT